MINYVYQLVSPKVFSVKYEDVSFDDKVIVKPRYMAVCHADQRYFLGQRDVKVLHEKLPMALIHECCGEVIYDPNNIFKQGDMVVLIPNTPVSQNDVIYENYAKGSYFLSSGHDGFMREFVNISSDRVVSIGDIPPQVAAITEFVSVGVHASSRFNNIAHRNREIIGIWGDGSLAYTTACIMKKRFKGSKIVVIGKDIRKLSHFSFCDDTYLADDLPPNFTVDHAFECCGGEGSYYAIDDIIRYINPQGAVVLMGVTENKVAINTRNVLEKGLTFVGCSRSGREDFEKAVELMKDKTFQERLSVIIFEDEPVNSIGDIAKIMANDLTTPFKTVFEWNT